MTARPARTVRAVLAALAACALAACAHRPAPQPALGKSFAPFHGRPTYLIAQASQGNRWVTPGAAPATDERMPVVGSRPLPTGAALERVRANLAAIDAHVAALGDDDNPEAAAALDLTTQALRDDLTPFTDLAAEVDELRHIVAELPDTPRARFPVVRARMNELTDLIRLQLVAGL
jgi:hypothetical protein